MSHEYESTQVLYAVEYRRKDGTTWYYKWNHETPDFDKARLWVHEKAAKKECRNGGRVHPVVVTKESMSCS